MTCPFRLSRSIWGVSLAAVLLLATGCDSTDPAEPVPPGGEPEPAILPVFFNRPAWHPAGRWIAAEHADSLDDDADGTPDSLVAGLWLVHAETGRKRPLIHGFSMPSWSADGQRLAMVRQGQIFTAEVSGSDPPAVDTSTIQQLTTTGRFFHPDLSPNGETVAYRNTTGDTVGVWLTPVDGSTRRSFFAYGGTPDWFPDGKRLLYPRDGEIWVDFSNRSTAERILSNLSGVIGSPTVSPTGDEIGFYTETSEGPTALYVIGSAGTHFRQISPPFSYALDWSPDGERLVFLRWGVNENHDFPGSGHLWTIRRDGSDLRQLTGR